MSRFAHNAALNAEKQYGSLEGYFDELSTIIPVNDGMRHCDQVVVPCQKQQAPVPFANFTEIPITSPQFVVTDISKTFLTARLEIPISIQGLDENLAVPAGSVPGTYGDTDRLAKLWVGFKSSRHAIEEIELLHNSEPCGYHDKYIVQEGFIDSTLSPWDSRARHDFEEALYDDVVRYIPSEFPGKYINLAEFANGQEQIIKFVINIPIKNFTAFQLFGPWLGRLEDWGTLAMRIYFSHTKSSLVVAQVNPFEVLDTKRFLQTDTILNEKLEGDVMKYTHQFTQINDPLFAIVNVETTGYIGQPRGTTGTATFTIGQIIVKEHGGIATQFEATIRGFDILQSARARINAKLRARPIIIPGQIVPSPTAFPIPPDDGGINTNLPMAYLNCAAIVLLFPKTSNQITVMENPQLKDLQLKVGNDFIPKKKFSTIDARFYKEQLIIADLDENNQATEEYTQSIIAARNDPTGRRYWNVLKDATSCVILFQTERGSGGLVFDGLTGSDLNTEITASAIHTGFNNTYYFPALRMEAGQIVVDTMRHPPAPQIHRVQDIFFNIHVSQNTGKVKIQYFGDRSPHGSQAE